MRRSTEYTLNPGILDQLRLAAEAVAEEAGVTQAIETGGGGFPWPIAVLGVAGAGAAVALLMPKEEDGTNGCPSGTRWDDAAGRCVPINGNGPTTGGIRITIPNP